MNRRQRNHLRMQRRATLYKMKRKAHRGRVPCFVCGKHVQRQDATLEHIVPQAQGGTDDMHNLDISHRACNQEKGDQLNLEPHPRAVKR